MKTCKLCGIEKKYEDFPKHSSYKDGYYSRCKKCNYALEKEWREKNPEKKNAVRKAYRDRNRDNIRSMDNKYYSENQKKRCEYQKKDHENKPEKRKAYILYRKALEEGTVIKKDYCQVCGKTGKPLEGHHADYAKPLEVIWVCKSCHAYIHKIL